MEYTKEKNFFDVCRFYIEARCDLCKYAQKSRSISRRNSLLRSRKLNEQAIARFQREIAKIDALLAGIDGHK